MDTRTTASPHLTDASDVAMQPQHEPDKISAYYSLVFPNFTYYLQTLSVTIGRRCIPATTGSSSDATQIDVDLGPLKSVSRLHAKIEYEEEGERFVLVVIGRNGAMVDGVWSPSGSRVSLSERSHIRIASRTFQFVLPPPPAPEDSPSPSSHSSINRPRSPSVDITSISPPSSMPSRSPPPTVQACPVPDIPPLPATQPPGLSNIGKLKPTPKKRKKPVVEPIKPPKPEDMPPRPPFTYAQLCYRAIKSTGGKATLQEICHWITDAFDWYKYNDAGWQSSVRHNLSSNRAFKKMERCGDARGKGFFWSVDAKFEYMFEEQDAKGQVGKLQDGSTVKEGKSGKKKDKGTSVLEPPLKRSVKGDPTGALLPPPLTSAPLKHSASTFTPLLAAARSAPTPIHAKSEAVTSQETDPRQSNESNASHSTSYVIPPSLCIPIIVGPIPASHSSSSQSPNVTGPLTSTPIVLHDGKLILNPDVFSHLTPEQITELEALGAQKALQILQSYIARFLKEQRLKKRESGRGRGRGRGVVKRPRGAGRKPEDGNCPTGDGSADGKPAQGPFTKMPLPPRTSHPRAVHDPENIPVAGTHPPSAYSIPAIVDAKPPVPIPMIGNNTAAGAEEEDTEAIIIVDDSDTLEAPLAKKRRLEVETIFASSPGTA